METVSLKQAIEIVKNGGIVIFPTDTAFAISCRVDDESAVARLFALRKRPVEKAVPVLVDDFQMAEHYWQNPVPEKIVQLTNTYWPGGLTIVYYAQTARVAPSVLGGGDTIGLRMPKHEIARRLIRGVGVPLVGTSANFAGSNTPYAFEELDIALVNVVDGVVAGSCTVKKASTVVDATENELKVLRQGAVTIT